MNEKQIYYADDDVVPVARLVRMRLPSILIGIALGVFLSFVTSRFEEVIARTPRIAFFIPLVVYLADAVGTQTQDIYIRDLRSGKANFRRYFLKELAVGFILGAASSILAAGIVLLWLNETNLALAVGLAILGAIATAPPVALITTELVYEEHTDPAVGAGPITTVIQDTLSVLIYGLIASTIIL
jgi:magnesium transporter